MKYDIPGTSKLGYSVHCVLSLSPSSAVMSWQAREGKGIHSKFLTVRKLCKNICCWKIFVQRCKLWAENSHSKTI